MSDAKTQRPDRRVVLYLIGAVAALPLIAAYVLYFFWRPDAFTNHGQLLSPTSIADTTARQSDGTTFEFGALRGKWLLVMVDSGACDAFCEGKLYRMRQVRLTQGRNMERIERAWLIDDDAEPAPHVTADFVGTRQIRAKGSAVLRRLPAQSSSRAHIYVVDPLGNVIIRYDGDADPTGMKKDLSRLLRASRIG
jgi:cytochrome oxidase Cu insertion factor (SCO1/SenC/PrrC family)